MCGRYTVAVKDPQTLQQSFDLASVPAVPSRYNVAPTQPVATVALTEAGRELGFMHWGLIPSWAKDASGASKLINARAETIAEKPMFRTAFKRRRCLVVATGFYEWRKNADGTKTPMYITLQDPEQPFGFAGLWERWTEPESGEILTTCTIITTSANELVEPIHNRMPVILPKDAYEHWLDPRFDNQGELLSLLQPYPAEKMQTYPVSTRVNNVRNEGAELMAPFPNSQ